MKNKSIILPVKYLVVFGLFLLVSVCIYFLWLNFTKPQGNQKVSFTPSKSAYFTEGKLNYCIYKAAKGVNEDIIYYFHGRNLDDTIWNDNSYYTSLIQSYWQNNNITAPTVVFVSFGPEWLLTPKNSSAESGLLDDFIKHLPLIESKIGKPKHRILLGESMGGLNVLILGLSKPSLFSKVASLCPGVYIDSPFSNLAKIKTALQRTGADPKTALGIYLFAKKYVNNENEWQEISPINLIKKANNQYPELYLSCGLYDKYGNFEGTEALANIATSKGVKTQWHPLYGGHCAIDIVSLANFLVEK